MLKNQFTTLCQIRERIELYNGLQDKMALLTANKHNQGINVFSIIEETFVPNKTKRTPVRFVNVQPSGLFFGWSLPTI